MKSVTLMLVSTLSVWALGQQRSVPELETLRGKSNLYIVCRDSRLAEELLAEPDESKRNELRDKHNFSVTTLGTKIIWYDKALTAESEISEIEQICQLILRNAGGSLSTANLSESDRKILQKHSLRWFNGALLPFFALKDSKTKVGITPALSYNLTNGNRQLSQFERPNLVAPKNSPDLNEHLSVVSFRNELQSGTAFTKDEWARIASAREVRFSVHSDWANVLGLEDQIKAIQAILTQLEKIRKESEDKIAGIVAAMNEKIIEDSLGPDALSALKRCKHVRDLPEGLRNSLRTSFVAQYKSHGFSSKEEAGKYFDTAGFSFSGASINVSLSLGMRNGADADYRLSGSVRW